MPEDTIDVERLQRLEDRTELRDLSARYCRALDDRDMPGLLELFCADAGFLHAIDGRGPVGHAELERFYSDVLAGYGFSVHVPHAQVVETLDGDDATGWVIGSAELAIGDRVVRTALRYDDRYRRIDGRWRFARRTTSFWYFADLDQLPTLGGTAERVHLASGRRIAELPETLDSYAAFQEARGDRTP
jgi:hypothetical protein